MFLWTSAVGKKYIAPLVCATNAESGRRSWILKSKRRKLTSEMRPMKKHTCCHISLKKKNTRYFLLATLLFCGLSFAASALSDLRHGLSSSKLVF